METPNDHTAVFHFSKPTPFQLIRNALPVVTSVVPKHLYEGTDIATNPANTKPVGTGPFVFAEYKPGEYYRLTRNPNYWAKNQPQLDEIIYRVLPDRAGAASALEAEEIQLAAFSAVPLADLARIAKQPGIKVIADGYEALTYQLVVEINHRRKELADLKVRKAIAHAIDKKFVIDKVFLGYATASTGPVPKNAPEFYTDDVETYDFDVAKANALLDEAGYARGPDGTRFALKLLPAPISTKPSSSAPICVRRSRRLASMPSWSITTPPRTRRPFIPTTPSISPLHRRCSVAIRRSRPPFLCAPAFRPASASPIRAGMRTRRSIR